MIIFPWTSDYCVGVPQFDQEHMQLVELTNKLYASILDGSTVNVASSVIDGLISYADHHLKHEERVMAETGYPHIDRHIAQHIWFAGRIRAFQQEGVDKAGTLAMIDVARELSLFLKSWLSGHLCSEDRELGHFLNARGIH